MIMHTKKSLLLVLLLWGSPHLLFSAENRMPKQNRTTPQGWLNPIRTLLTKIFTHRASPIKNWQEIYQNKENSQKSIVDSKRSAQKFKIALEEAAKKNKIMSRFDNKPETFFFGASSSSYQYEGGLDANNANSRFYQQNDLPTAQDAIDFWDKYETDIEQLKNELGINSFRISIAWDRVAPSERKYDTLAIEKYTRIIKTLKKYNIEPIVVLHHYTVPTWFEDRGGFEKKENIHYFVDFAKQMYNALCNDVTYWSTFNAIEGYAFKGYFRADGPPGKKDMQLTQQVMAHMLESHVRIYNAFKKQYKTNKNIPNPQIGIQKNIVLLDPSGQSNICVQTITGPICVLGTMLQNKGFFDFFRTGKFKVWVPGMVNISYTNTLAPRSIDWIGLNVYSNMLMRLGQNIPEDNPDFTTENLNYRDYPEGIYRAVKVINDALAKPLGIPIFITENGIATQNNEAGNNKRTRFLRRVLYTIRKLIEEGYPIIGYTPWASHDNYEWPSQQQPNPYDRPYGMFAVNFDKNSPDYMKRTLKTGSYYYRNFLQEYFKLTKLVNTPIETWKE